MDPWFAKAAVIAATVALIAIRAPHGHRSRTVKVKSSRRGRLEFWLLVGAWAGCFLSLLWIFGVPRRLFAATDYPLCPAAWGVGVAFYALGLWLFYRSHKDLVSRV